MAMKSDVSKHRDDTCLVYDVPEAGAMIGLTKNGSYRAAASGDLPTIRIGRLLKVPKAALHALIDGAGAK